MVLKKSRLQRREKPLIWREIDRYAQEIGLSIENAAKEVIHHITLHVCAEYFKKDHLKHNRWTLFGRTSLRIGYGSPRFSEDLDFCMSGEKGMIIDTWVALERRLKRNITRTLGGKVHIVKPRSLESDVVRFRILYTPPGTQNKISIHLDNQTMPSLTRRPRKVVPPLRVSEEYEIPMPNEEELLADKLAALMGRPYVSGRDLFDIAYFLKNINPELIARKMKAYKMGEGSLQRLEQRMEQLSRGDVAVVNRALDEWQRYLPDPWNRKDEFYHSIETIKNKLKTVIEKIREVLVRSNDKGKKNSI